MITESVRNNFESRFGDSASLGGRITQVHHHLWPHFIFPVMNILLTSRSYFVHISAGKSSPHKSIHNCPTLLTAADWRMQTSFFLCFLLNTIYPQSLAPHEVRILGGAWIKEDPSYYVYFSEYLLNKISTQRVYDCLNICGEVRCHLLSLGLQGDLYNHPVVLPKNLTQTCSHQRKSPACLFVQARSHGRNCGGSSLWWHIVPVINRDNKYHILWISYIINITDYKYHIDISIYEKSNKWHFSHFMINDRIMISIHDK